VIVIIVLAFIAVLCLSVSCTTLAACGVERLTALVSLVRGFQLAKQNHFNIIMSIFPIIAIDIFFVYLYRYLLNIYEYNTVLSVILITAATIPLSFNAVVLAVVYCQLKVAEESNNFLEESSVFDQ
jgi:hypothetical protein